MITIGYLIMALCVVVAFIFVILFGTLNYKMTYQKKYSFLQNFPYEFNDNIRMKLRPLMIILYGTFIAVLASFYIYVFKDLGYTIYKIEIALGALVSLLTLVLFMVRILTDQIHVILSSIYFAMSTIHTAFLGYANLVFNIYVINDALPYLLFALCLIQLILIFNPKLKKWMNLETDENGMEIRPKIFILAFTEWLFLFINVLQVILLATGISL